MFENPRRGRQARNVTTNDPKILDFKSSSEQIFSKTCRWVSLIVAAVDSICKKRQRKLSHSRWVDRNKQSSTFLLRIGTLFSLPLFFTLVAASISHFHHSRHKIFMSFLKRNWSSWFFMSGSSSFSIIHTNVDFKIKLKGRIGFVVEVRVAMRFTAETRGNLKCKISLLLTWMGGRT